jgi:hypothetical protein
MRKRVGVHDNSVVLVLTAACSFACCLLLSQHTAALEESVAQHKADNSRNTRDVQNIQRREQLLAEVQLARQRMPWVQYDARFAAHEKDTEV